MRVGIHLPQYGRVASSDAIARAARLAEERGFADVWVSDHIVHPAAQDYPSPYLLDPLLSLTWAAAVTSEVGLGTSVLVVPQYHPLWLANATSSLDALSGGRLILGVGVGWSEAEFDALGQGFVDRGRRTDEMLEILQACWTTDPTSFAGEFYEFTDIRVQPKPAHPIDIWVGGSGPAARRRAARFGAGYQLIGLDAESIVEPVRQLRADHPDPERFTISLRTGWDPQGMDVDRIRREREAFEAAGVQHVVSAPWRSEVDDWLRSMELLADIVERAPMSAQLRDEYDTDGFATIRGFADPAVGTAMLDDVVALVRAHEVGEPVDTAIVLPEAQPDFAGGRANPEDVVSKVFRLHRRPAFASFLRTPALLPIITELLGTDDVDCFLSQFIFKNPGAWGQPWHQDSYYFPFEPARPIVGLWLAVTEATLENGCLHVLPGSHREAVQEHVPDRREGANYGYTEIVGHDTDGECPALMRPGDLLVFDSHLMHRSTDNGSDGIRAAMVFHVAAAGTVDRTEEVRGYPSPVNDWVPLVRGGAFTG